jgi:hypothetical protein
MATEQYMSPLYAAFLSAYDINDDTAPTTDPDMFKQYVVLRKTAQDYAKSFNVSVLRRETDMVKSALKAQEQSQSYHAKLEGIKSDDRQATVKALTDRANNIDDNYTRLAGQMSKFDSQLFLPAQSAFQNSGGNAAQAWETLFRTTTDRGIRAVGSDPESVGLATQIVKMTMNNADLRTVNADAVEAAVTDAGGNATLAANAAQFVRDAKAKNNEVIVTLDALDKSRQGLRDITAMGRTQDFTQEQVKRAQRVSAEAEEVLKNSFGGTPEELSERLEDLRARDTEYQGLLNDARKAFDLAVQPGQEGLRTRMGRLLANEDFAAWAQDNGFKKLGRSKIDENGEVVYVQGLDDAQAIARYAYQLQHPDRHGPLFGRRGSTNQLVRITATDPEQRAQILEQNKLEDGRYAVDAEGALLSPRDYAQQMEKEGFAPTIQYATDDGGKVYLKNGEGAVYTLLADGETYEQVSAPEGLNFQPAIVYGEDDAPLRYMTQTDILGGEKKVGYDNTPDQGEVKQITEKSPIRLVGADEIQGLGEVSVLGYRDRFHARDAAQYGTGAISINGGKQVFTKGSKIEILSEDEPNLAADVARMLPKEPKQQALATAAQTQEVSLQYEPLSRADVAALEVPAPPPPPPAPEAGPNAMEQAAAKSGPNTYARAELLERQGLGTVGGVLEAARDQTPPEPAAPKAPARFTDDAGYVFEVDEAAKKIKVVDVPKGKSMPKKQEFTYEEVVRLDMARKFKPIEASAPAPTAAAPTTSATSTAPTKPTGPVRVEAAPPPKPPPYQKGAMAGSPTVTYKTEKKPTPNIGDILTRITERRSSPGKNEKRRSEDSATRTRRLPTEKEIANLPEAEGTAASTSASRKSPVALTTLQRAANLRSA